MTEKPLDGLTIGFVTQLARELENTCGANDGHANTASTAVNLAVTVLGGRLLDGETRRLLPLRVNDCAVTDGVGGSFRVRHGFGPSERQREDDAIADGGGKRV